MVIEIGDDWDNLFVAPTPSTGEAHYGTAGCGGCDTRWAPGTNICHCASCHETFSALSPFDHHRATVRHKGRASTIRCLTLDEMRSKVDADGKPVSVTRQLVQDERGYWRGPSRPEGWTRDE